MQTIRQELFTDERSLFHSNGLEITDCVFSDGESPLKESSNLKLSGCLLRWKYPLWYCKDIEVENCTWYEGARAGVWYTDRIRISDSMILAPKNFRRCDDLTLKNVTLTDAKETLWSCSHVNLDHVTAKGDYFLMNSRDLRVDSLYLDGNYSFDGAKNVEIRNSKLITKDAFWNSENITVYDSFISGEYLGWNSKNLTLVNCVVESLQGMCYIDNLVMKNCKLLNTTLAFEYSSVDVSIDGKVDSVFNPKSGTITADEIGELIIEKDLIDPEKTKITCKEIKKTSDHPEWP